MRATDNDARHAVVGLIVLVILVTAVGGILYWLAPMSGEISPLVWPALTAAAGWFVRSWIERSRAHERLLAEQKREQYFQLLDFMNEIISSGGDEPDEARINEWRRWALRLALVGSDDVVQKWNAARAGAKHGGLSNALLWGDLLLSMRKDCGHFGTQLDVRDMLATFVNDLDEAVTKEPATD